MKSYKKNFIYSILLLVSLACSNPNAQPIRHRLIYSNDGGDVLGNTMFDRRPLSVEDAKMYVDVVANTQVTTFMICTGSDYTYYRSKYGRIYGDVRNGTLNCGQDTSAYKNLVRYYRNHLNLEEKGTDIIDACLRRAKEKGLEAFITYWMNDLHFNDTTSRCPIEYPDFWLAHPQYWLNEDVGWKSKGAFDFAHKEVREHKLDMIGEQLEKYGEFLDGYELNFMRFFVYFKSEEGEKNAPLMTELVTAVKAKIDELSAKRGKRILLSVRVAPDLDFCLKKGLDIKGWVRQGLIDFVTIGVHFTGNPSIPVGKFKADLAAPSIPVYVATESGGYNSRVNFSHGMYRGTASHVLAQGGDGIYLFNFSFDNYLKELRLEAEGNVCRIITPELQNELGSLETLRRRNKIYCLDDGGSAGYGYKPDTPLPLLVSPDNYVDAPIFVGDNIQKDVPEEAIIFLRTDKPAQFELLVNGVKVETQKPEYVSLFDRAENLSPKDRVYAFILPASCLKQGDNVVRLRSATPKKFITTRVEIALRYGDVKTHGYF